MGARADRCSISWACTRAEPEARRFVFARTRRSNRPPRDAPAVREHAHSRQATLSGADCRGSADHVEEPSGEAGHATPPARRGPLRCGDQFTLAHGRFDAARGTLARRLVHAALARLPLRSHLVPYARGDKVAHDGKMAEWHRQRVCPVDNYAPVVARGIWEVVGRDAHQSCTGNAHVAADIRAHAIRPLLRFESWQAVERADAVRQLNVGIVVELRQPSVETPLVKAEATDLSQPRI